MSSICVIPVRGKERSGLVTEWGEADTQDVITGEIEYGRGVPRHGPVAVEHDKLEIESAQLDIGRVYQFEYLGSQMVLWKSPSGAIDLFEIVEE